MIRALLTIMIALFAHGALAQGYDARKAEKTADDLKEAADEVGDGIRRKLDRRHSMYKLAESVEDQARSLERDLDDKKPLPVVAPKFKRLEKDTLALGSFVHMSGLIADRKIQRETTKMLDSLALLAAILRLDIDIGGGRDGVIGPGR